MTTMLLVVTFSFLVLLAWQCITQCFWMEYGREVDEGFIWLMVDGAFAFAKLGVVINSAINVFLYCLSGRIFRKELCKMISSCCLLHKRMSYQRTISTQMSTVGTVKSEDTRSHCTQETFTDLTV